MFPMDLFVFGVILAVLLLIFFIYLMLRRSLLAFKEGFEDG